jgi:Flp pilus assembly protein TadB
MSRYESLRASDADRDAVTDRLRQAAGEGRLEPEELEQRLDRALRARTYGELAPLVADLPRRPNTPWRPPGRRTRTLAQSAVRGAGLLAAVAVAVAVVAVVVVLLLAAAAFAAAWWIVCVVVWLVCRGSRRRLVSGSARRRAAPRRAAHRPRPTGLL